MNLIDSASVDAYLENFLPSDVPGAELLKLALGKVLRKREANMEEVRTLPKDAPEWLRKKWRDNGPYHRFKADSALQDRVWDRSVTWSQF